MDVAAFIDWFAVTHFGSAEIATIQALPTQAKEAVAHNGYTSARKYTTGVIEMWNTERPKMGRHFIYSGKVLQLIQNTYGVERDSILRTHIASGGRVSRCDFAIDIRNGALDLVELWSSLEAKTAKTISSHSRVQTGHNGGDTVYVGSRKTRAKMVRIYDKAKEVGDFISDFVRVELEVRGNIARNATRTYQDNNYSPSSILGMVRAVVDFPEYENWTNVFRAHPSKIPTGNNQATDREKWLIGQVAPALAQAMLDNPNFFSDFISHVTFHYNERNT